MNITSKTKIYIAAFDQKNLGEIEDMFCEDAVLFDPANALGLNGREAIIKMISGLFGDVKNLSFKAENIFVDQNTSIIEFSLQLDQKLLKGVDIINWQDGKIAELRAYLY